MSARYEHARDLPGYTEEHWRDGAFVARTECAIVAPGGEPLEMSAEARVMLGVLGEHSPVHGPVLLGLYLPWMPIEHSSELAYHGACAMSAESARNLACALREAADRVERAEQMATMGITEQDVAEYVDAVAGKAVQP